MSIINAAGTLMRTSTTRSPRNTLVVGSEAPASKFYQEMIAREGPGRVRLVKGKDLGGTKVHQDVTRIVIADPKLAGDADLAHTLIDYKLRGGRVETIVDSYEKTSRMIWLEGLSPQWLVLANGFNPSSVY